MMDILLQFAERLKEMMFDAKITPEQLSICACQNVYDIYHWTSNGNRYMPSVGNLVKLANYFSCSIEFLIGICEENTLPHPNPNKMLPDFSLHFLTVLKKYETNLYRLGKTTNTSTTTYYRWVNKKAAPSIDSLLKISNALGCSVDRLLGRDA